MELSQGIPEQTVEEIRQRCDLVDLVGEYLTLEKRGKNMLGLCPFHNEKTPSFSVSPEKQLFHCFGCGASGNVFSFVMKQENLTFPEAARFLARRAGITIPERKVRTARDDLREQILALNSLAARYYSYCLRESAAGKKTCEYLQERGITPASSELFMLGFAPPGWSSFTGFAQKKGVSPDVLLKSGLVSPRESGGIYDRFRNRLIFPIADLGGRIVGFGGRALDEGEKSGPKYLNSPETAVFNKSMMLYGLNLARDEIRKEKTAVVVEGYTDVITAHQHGLKNVVASLGTALTAAHARLLRSQAEKVVIAYDADSAGEAATWRGLKILRDAGCLVKVADLPAGGDPDSLIREKGSDAFARLVREAKPLVEYQLAVLRKRHDPGSEEGRRSFVAETLSLLRTVSDLVERDFYLKKVSEELGVTEEALRGELKRHRQNRNGVHNLSLKDQTNNINQLRVNPAEKMLLALMIGDEETAAMVCGKIHPDDIENEQIRRILEAICKLHDAGNPVTGEGLVNIFEDPELHTLITVAATEPSIQELPREKLQRMAVDCLESIFRTRLARQQQDGQQQIKQKDKLKQGPDEQARSILREQLEMIKKLKGRPYRSGGGEDLNG